MINTLKLKKNVILTLQTCGQRSSRAAESERRMVNCKKRLTRRDQAVKTQPDRVGQGMGAEENRTKTKNIHRTQSNASAWYRRLGPACWHQLSELETRMPHEKPRPLMHPSSPSFHTLPARSTRGAFHSKQLWVFCESSRTFDPAVGLGTSMSGVEVPPPELRKVGHIPPTRGNMGKGKIDVESDDVD